MSQFFIVSTITCFYKKQKTKEKNKTTEKNTEILKQKEGNKIRKEYKKTF